jgi:hypothetical protein
MEVVPRLRGVRVSFAMTPMLSAGRPAVVAHRK